MFSFFKKRTAFLQSEIEPHEILLDKLAKKKEEKWGLSERKFEVPLLKRILQGFFYFSILLFLFFFLKTFQFQIIEGKEFLSQAEENRYIFHKIQAQRGVIYDGEDRQLVFNRLSFDLVCEKNNLPQSEIERKKIFKEVSQVLKMNSDELGKKIQESEDLEALISQNLDHQTLIILETKIKDLQGFKIIENSIREYKDGEYFSHLIGFMGKIKSEEWKNNPEFYLINDYVGRAGIENYYEDILRKNPGKLRLERDARGNIISKEVISLPESGKSLVLWLDSDLQKKIEDELEKKVKEVGAKGAAAVALNPKTGGVMALVSYPNFDNNLFSKEISPEEWKKIDEDPLKPLFNRAIAGTYLTGSTIKPLIASAALEEKIISPDKKINDDKGKILVQDYWNPEKIWEYNDWTIHGWTDMRKAIAESCNVYFYTVGGGYGDQEGLGPTKIKEYLEKFGWNQKTGIDLPGEVEGFIPDKEWKKKTFPKDPGWWDGDTYNLSIGQGYLKITPLEVAASFVPIANGGKMFQPKVVQKIIDSEKNVIEEIQPQILKENFIDPKNLQIVREGMREAVTYGSAVVLNDLPVKVAAKTGTAELGGDYYHNWITVFAPYENPEIVLTIVIEKVKDVRVAVLPVAREILNWYFTREVNY